MNESIVYDKAFKLSIRIYKLHKFLRDKNEYEIASQILRSGTSIGANIAESRGTVSDLDFSNKLSISYKESLETKYWLDLILAVNLIEEKKHISIYNDVDEISKMLWKAIKITKERNIKKY